MAASTLGSDYKHTYDFVSGFLKGSSFAQNKDCVNNLNDITYYGLLVLQTAQNFKVQDAMTVNLNLNKLTEATGRFTR